MHIQVEYGGWLMSILDPDPDPDPGIPDPDRDRHQIAFIPNTAAEAALRTPVTKEPCLFHMRSETKRLMCRVMFSDDFIVHLLSMRVKEIRKSLDI